MASGYTFHNNVAPFPSRPVQPRPTSTFPQPPLRTLPTFGSPNEFPNPSSHYFPSKPGAYNKRDTRTRSPESEDDTAAAGDERARKAPLGPFPSAVGAGGGARRRLDRTTWDAGSELMREEAEEQAKAAGGAAAAAGASGGADVDMDQDRDDDNDDNADAKSTASGKDTSKKRSRTLTTAHQTAVLNALLAKVRCWFGRTGSDCETVSLTWWPLSCVCRRASRRQKLARKLGNRLACRRDECRSGSRT